VRVGEAEPFIGLTNSIMHCRSDGNCRSKHRSQEPWQ